MLGSNCELVRVVPVAWELIVGRRDAESLVSGKSDDRCMYRCGRLVIVIVAVPVTVGSSLVVVP